MTKKYGSLEPKDEIVVETPAEPEPPRRRVDLGYLVGKRLTNYTADGDRLVELVFEDATRLKFDRVKLQ